MRHKVLAGSPRRPRAGDPGLGRPDKRYRDLDNAATKAALDLVEHDVIADDSLVTSITSSWDAKVPAGRILIVVRAL